MPSLRNGAQTRTEAVADLQAELPALRGAIDLKRLGSAGAAQGAVGGDRESAGRAAKGAGAGVSQTGACANRRERPGWVADRLREFSLGRIEANVVLDQNDGCWLWRGPMLRGLARVCFAHKGEQIYLDARRLVFEVVRGFEPPLNMMPRCDCNGLCVHPDHLRLVKRSSAPRDVALWRKRLRIAQEQRSGMTLDKARAIRASSERLVDVAAKHGCCVATASKIRRGLVWPEPDHAFAGMGEGWRG